MKTLFYPAFLEKEHDGCSVMFPDLPGCYSAGEDIADTVKWAEEAVALYLEDFPFEGEEFPQPSRMEDLVLPAGFHSIVLVRAQVQEKQVRMTVVLPSNIFETTRIAAQKFGLSRSALVNRALSEWLKDHHP